jgi:hypothetical protein
MTNQLTIANTAIRQDAEGRYCLNDLHKAAGGIPKHRPGEWLKTAQVQELVAEIESANIVAVYKVMGRNGGTFVVKELVYAYAMWISPAFHLKVIRAYDELQTQGVAFSEQTVEKVATGEMSEDELVMKAMTIMQTKVERLKAERDGLVKTVGKFDHTINRVVRMLDGVNTNRTKADLCDQGYLYRRFGHYRVYSKYRHLFVEKFDDATGRGNIYCTPEGKALLARLYEEGKLTMKVGYRAA